MCALYRTRRSDPQLKCRLPLASSLEYAAVGKDADQRNRNHDQNYKNERTGPCQAVPFIVRGDGVDVDLQRQGGDGLAKFQAPELIAEGGEKKRRGLSGDAGEGKHASGNNAGRGRAQTDRDCGPPLGDSETESYTASEGREVSSLHQKRKDGDAHDNRRNTVQDIGSKAYRSGKGFAAAKFCQIDTGGNADRDTHQAGESKDNSGANDCVGHPTTLLANRSRNMGEEV